MLARGGQVLNCLTFASTLSHLCCLNPSIGRDGKLAKPRQLRNTLWGMVCPAETPEASNQPTAHGCIMVQRGTKKRSFLYQDCSSEKSRQQSSVTPKASVSQPEQLVPQLNSKDLNQGLPWWRSG
ncbi:uncharacterized protein AAG666_014429 isoform 2-T2 [Megaptera novaeangliae]